ncbi:MAG: FtsX-like permease family protein [Chitinophagaceae bacterium]|nr:FtsX-like permease family protein [Chitinophagaceae bacterium]
MNFLFAWRYFKAKKTTQAINVIAWVSVVAIAIITAAFVIMMSVFNGFEGLVKELYASFYADLRVVPANGKVIFVSDAQWQRVQKIKGLKAASRIIEEKALLQNQDLQTIVFLKGVEDSYQLVTDIPAKIIRGKYFLGSTDQPAIVLGSGIEHAVAADVERSIYPLTVYLFRRGVPVSEIDPYQSFSAENIQGAGTFFIQQDIDSKYALTNIGLMQNLLKMKPNEYGAIELAVQKSKDLESAKKELQSIFGKEVLVETRYEQNKSLYRVMQMEKWAGYGLMTLMLIVAAFTMVGALTMLVMEKQKDIQVLKSFGASQGWIQRTFLSEGLVLGGIGVIAGLILGIGICFVQQKFHLIKIQGGTFLLDHYPVSVHLFDTSLIAVTVVIVTVLASWFPARKASLQAIELKS